MIARLAYLTTPAPDRFVLNIQPEGGTEFIQYEISRAHLANILIDGTALALRDNVRLQAIHHKPATGEA